MIITTTFNVSGYVINEILGVVSANQVLGNNLISENIAALTDIFGGKSGEYRNKLDELIDDARNQLIDKASAMNANAIVGFSVSTNQISGKGMSMFMVTAIGTAVCIEPDRYAILEKLHKLNTYLKDGILSQEEYEYEESRITQDYDNVIASETRAASEKKLIQQALQADARRRTIEEEKKLAARQAQEAEARRKYEEEHADEIKEKTKFLDYINQEFPKHKADVEGINLNDVSSASYEGQIPEIVGVGHYDIIRYLVSSGNVLGACKYYCDKYHLDAGNAKDYLLGIYDVL